MFDAIFDSKVQPVEQIALGVLFCCLCVRIFLCVCVCVRVCVHKSVTALRLRHVFRLKSGMPALSC